MLIKDDHIFFHIDFGHLWNQGPLIDAPRIAIPMRLKARLAPYWTKFEKLCFDAFKVLYQHGNFIKNLCITLFESTTEKSVIIEQFVGGPNSLMLYNMEESDVYQKFQKTLTKSLANHHVRRKLKNWAHELSKTNTGDFKRRDAKQFSSQEDSDYKTIRRINTPTSPRLSEDSDTKFLLRRINTPLSPKSKKQKDHTDIPSPLLSRTNN